MPDTRSKLRDWTHEHTFCIFESLKLKGLYIGDLLIDQQIFLGKALLCHNKFAFWFFLMQCKGVGNYV